MNMPDKFAATWVSHSSASDFLKCPRAYFLNHVYRDPKTKHKIQLVSPPLALGSAVHEVLESLSALPTADRLKVSLIERFNQVWKKLSGKKGGFSSQSQEDQYRARGEDMLRRVMKNPGPITRLAVKIKQDLPSYWLSQEDEIILCGKIDWLEYFPDTDSVHIVDFKTSKKEESGESLQLPIYRLLVENCQHRKVDGASYWYIGFSETLSERELPDSAEAHERVLEVAKKMKLARKLGVFKCPQGSSGCMHCRPVEKIVAGEAEFVGVNDYNQDMYMLPDWSAQSSAVPESEVL
jgi:ATP-dependent helicase/DNAse subunit B